MMKICIITAATNTILRFRMDMIEGFLESGCEVTIFGDENEKKWGPFFKEKLIDYHEYPVSRNGLNPFEDLRTKRAITSLLAHHQPDAIFTYQAKPNIYGCLAARDVGIKNVYVMMGGLGSIFNSNGIANSLLRSFIAFQYRVSLRNAKKVFFQNYDDINTFKKLKIIDSCKQVLVKGSGVNTDFFTQEELPDKKALLFVGRLVKGKGVFEYLEACKVLKDLYPDVQFHLVGPFDSNPTSLSIDQLKPYIEDEIIIYHGEQDDVRPFLKNCTAFVLPSYYGEGTPKSALEAMSTGRALIMADEVGCREVVEHGVNGYLVPAKNVDALKEKMECIINDPELARKMGQKSRQMAESVFDVKKVNEVIYRTMEI